MASSAGFALPPHPIHKPILNPLDGVLVRAAGIRAVNGARPAPNRRRDVIHSLDPFNNRGQGIAAHVSACAIITIGRTP
jgi:hypothetical protein